MQKFFHKSQIFNSPWSSAYHICSTLLLKVIMTTLMFQKNLTHKKKQKCRKATKEMDTAYMKQFYVNSAPGTLEEAVRIILPETRKRFEKLTSGQQSQRYLNFSLVMGIKM